MFAARASPVGVATRVSTQVKQRQQVDLIQLTDLHLSHDADATLGGVDAKANFVAILDYLTQHFIADKLVLTGDLSHDSAPQTLSWLADTLAHYGLSEGCHWLLGNHDDPTQTAQALVELNGAKEWVQKGWQVILLNTHSGAPHGWLARSELERLQRLTQGDAPILIMQHHHPRPIDAFIDKHRLENADELAACIRASGNVRLLAHGHVHQDLASDWLGLKVLACPATSVQFGRTADFSLTTEKPGFRWFKLAANGDYDTGVVRVANGQGADPRNLNY